MALCKLMVYNLYKGLASKEEQPVNMYQSKNIR
jgi:hypothetical protein